MTFTKGYTPHNKGKKGLYKMSDENKRLLGLRASKQALGNSYAKGHIGPRDNENCMWKGDLATSGAIHKWVVVRFGRPSYCQICESRIKKKYEWANIDHSYKRNTEDWLRLCTSCHRKYDMQNNNYRVAYLDK